MIRLILEIEEESRQFLGDIVASHMNIEVCEIRNKDTKNERETLEIIKDRIGVDQKVQIIDKIHTI